MTETNGAPGNGAPLLHTPVGRIFTATLVIGVPGSGKTSLFKGFAEYLWETYKSVLLLYSTDGGAIPTDVQKRMKQGLIRFWRMRTRSAPGLGLETMYLASRGYWPRYINAETGETTPAVQLVPPVTVKYVVTCPQNHPLSTVPSISLVSPMFCTPCGQFIGMTDLRVSEQAARTKGFEAVGGVGFDGLTSFTDGVLDHMDLQRGEGLIGGEKAAFGGVVTSGNQKFGGNNRADVGFGQTRGHQFVNNSLSIPYLREGPVWTALAMEATDEGGLPIVGPKLPGRAATDEASAWFGNVMETGKSPNDEGKSCFTLWLRPFTDAQNRRHLLKTSASATGLPDLLRDPPPERGQPYTIVNLGSVFKMLDEDLRRALLEDLQGAPGTPLGITEYGEASTIEQVSVAPPAPGGMPIMGPAGGTVASPPAASPATGGAPSGIATGIPYMPKMGSAPAPAANGAQTAAGPALMVAQPRARKRNQPQTMPVAAEPPPPAAAAPPAPAVPVQSTPPTPAGSLPVDTMPLPAITPGPVAAPAGSVPAASPVNAAAAVVTTAAAPTVAGVQAAPSGLPVMGAPSGTKSPPPPGMRPPARVPGS